MGSNYDFDSSASLGQDIVGPVCEGQWQEQHITDRKPPKRHLLDITLSRFGQPPQLSIIFMKNLRRLNHAIETRPSNPFGIADFSLSSWHVLNPIDAEIMFSCGFYSKN